jgi:hypothetical protein
VEDADPGGLAGDNDSGGTIVNSYATGSIRGTDENGETYLGGITTNNDEGTISNSYATVSIKAKGQESPIGGFLSLNNSTVSTSYATGKLTGDGGPVGGFVGQLYGGAFQYDYWDTTTSGTDQGTGEGNASGITGLTSKQLRKKLPAGFDPTIWAQDPKINNGFPYLITNPPREK